MRRILLVAALVALAVPGQALATEIEKPLPPGYTIRDESTPMAVEFGINECLAGHGFARRIGHGIWYGDDLAHRSRVKLGVCANNGRCTRMFSDFSYIDSHRSWRKIWGPFVERWKGEHSCGVRAKMQWLFSGVIDQSYSQALRLTAHVKRGTDHKVWFEEKRRWF